MPQPWRRLLDAIESLKFSHVSGDRANLRLAHCWQRRHTAETPVVGDHAPADGERERHIRVVR
jgi:hypothetical protein